MKITSELCKKVLDTVDAGLCSGKGTPTPGEMCVEAAVCYAMGLPHSDEPTCVDRAVRAAKITLNDCNWSSNSARAAGLRKVAVAQLGSASQIDPVTFANKYAELTIRRVLPIALRAIGLTAEADRCESKGTTEAASRAVRAAHDAAYNTVYADRSVRAALAARAAARSAHDAASSAYAAAYAARAAARSAHDAASSAYAAAAAYAARAAARSAHDAASSAYAARAAARSAHDAASSAYAAAAAVHAATNTTSDHVLRVSADCLLEALIFVKSPGCEFLDLCD